MTIEAGSRLLHYRVLAKIGEGGMGVVWKALDTTLDREVAIKVLPAAFAADAERLARFQREAKLLASLNHPGIAAIYGLHEADTAEGGVRFLAMELVDGEDLSQRLARGPLPVDEALEIAARIAEALSAAHEAGVIHRDLKPANVKRTPEGKVKVLDFGLAKAFEPRAASGGADPSNSPTLTSAGTMAGVILGTAAYMSPEQARGRPTDRRTDLWSFGAVLFEMLAGRPPFPGETISDVLAKVIEREPDWTRLPSPLHPGVRRLLERCLAKDADRRLRDAADARLELEELRADPKGERQAAVPAARPGLRALPWLLAAALAGWVVVAPMLDRAPAPERRVRFEINPPTGHQFAEFSAAPDGSAVAYVGVGRDTRRSLWIRPLESTEHRQLPGTEGAWFPFWSPDARYLGFFSRGKLRSIEVATGTTQTIADAPNGRGGAWGPDGTIVFTPEGEEVLYRVPASGGTPVPVTRLRDDEATHRFPHFLRGTNRFTYSAHDSDPSKTLRRYLASLDSDEVTRLDDGMSETYVPPGYALFVRESTLFAQPLDARNGRLTGKPRPLAQDIDDTFPRTGRSAFSVSDNGVLMTFARRKVRSRVDAVDRLGRRLETVVPGGDYEQLSLSRDGRRLLFTRTSVQESTVWRMDLARASTTRLLVLPRPEVTVAWSGDGRDLIWGSGNEIRRLPVGGGEPTSLVDGTSREGGPLPNSIAALAVSPDGRFASYASWDPVTDFDLWLLPLAGDRRPVRLTDAVGVQIAPAISPDSRWIAYVSNESGRYEVLVRSAVESAPGRYSSETWLVSNAGGSTPVWSPDGRELYYVSADYGVMAVAVGRGPGGEFQAGVPVRLFDGPLSVEDNSEIFFRQPSLVAVDADRFLFQVPDEEVRDRTIEVVIGWESLLER